MIKIILNYYHIRFQKGHRFRILCRLIINFLIEMIWRLKKRILGIHHPVVHVYAVCWNEEKIIPFFLQHYNEFVDHYYIYDNYSDDRTDELLASQSNVTIRKYETEGTINDLVYQKLKNSIWKQSRGKADWVIVIDMDEFLYHDEIKFFLSNNLYKSSIFQTEGFDMVAESFPSQGEKITDTIKKGVPNSWLNKMVIFDPYRIVEINYEPGAHEATPEGIVSIKSWSGLQVLHYKYIGLDSVMSRISLYRKRLSQVNIEMDYGTHYFEEDQSIVAKFNKLVGEAFDVI